MAYELDIHYIDVGQGDCTLIVIREEVADPNPHSQFDLRIVRTVLIDCGTKSTSSAFRNPPENSLLEKLIELRVQKLDIVIVSHYDEDHYSGIDALLGNALTDPNIRRLFQGTKIYDQGLVYSKIYNLRGFKDYRPDGEPLSGFPLINSYLNHIDQLNVNFNTGIQRMTQRVLTGLPMDYENGVWKNFYRAQYDLQWETGKFDNTQEQQILVQDFYWKPSAFEEGYYDLFKFDSVKYYSVQTLPCHHFVGADLLNHGFAQRLNGVELWCTAANGYTAQPDAAGNFTPQLAYSNEGDWNKFSLGLLLCSNGFTHWFGGDLETEQEESCLPFIQEKTQGGRLTVMKASHHGSNASTSMNFLTGLFPELVIISCGNWSQHHHPHVEVIRRLTLVNPRPAVIMTNAPEYEELNYGIIPSFYNPGGMNTQFYISGSSLEEVIGNISLRFSSIGRSVTYWEQNHRFKVFSNDLHPTFQFGTSISVAQLIGLLETQYQYYFNVHTDTSGIRRYVLVDHETGRIAGYFSDDLLYLKGQMNPFGQISGNSYNVPF